MTLWFTQFREWDTIVHIHWKIRGVALLPPRHQVSQQFRLAESTVPGCGAWNRAAMTSVRRPPLSCWALSLAGCVTELLCPPPFRPGRLLSRQTKPTDGSHPVRLTCRKPGGCISPAGADTEACDSWSALLVPNTTWRSRPSPSNSNSKGDAPHPAHLWGPALLPGPTITILFPNPSGSNQAKMFGKVGLAPTPSWGRERPPGFQSGSRHPETRKDDGSQESKSCNGKEVWGIRTSHSNRAPRLQAPPPAGCPSVLTPRTLEHRSGLEA